MKSNIVYVVAVCAPILLTALTVSAQTPLGREFTYQGRLSTGGSPLNATADLEFSLWDDPTAGSQIGATQAVSNVTVVNGLFAAELDFGANAFLNEARWLEISVASPSGGGLTTLSPRQPITASPFALQTRGIVVENNGNVAIGTNSSAERLTVAASSDPTIRIENTSTGSATLQFAAVDHEYEWRLKATDNLGLYDNTAGVERMTIDTAGNVGIGDATPSTKLDVSGTVTASAFVGDGSGLTGIGDGHSLDAADGVPADAVFVDNAGFVGIGTTTPAERLHISAGSPELLVESTGSLAAGLQFQNTDHAYSIRMTSGEKFVLRDLTAGNVDRLSIDTSGQVDIGSMTVLPSGPVGIGTTTPQHNLHVSSAASTPAKFESSNTTATRLLISNTDSTGQAFDIGVTGTAAGVGFGNFQIRDVTAGGLPRLMIDSIGRVGIGTTSPLYRLDVGGPIRAQDSAIKVTDNSDNDRVRLDRNPVNDVGFIETSGPTSTNVGIGYVTGTPDHGYVGVRDSAGGDRAQMAVDSNGGGAQRTYGPNGVINTEVSYLSANNNHGFVGVYGAAGVERAAIFVNDLGQGQVNTDVLQLLGGADIAEPFDIQADQAIEPGMVVSIDPDRPGDLRLSTDAYDRTVAGVISGAGGVNPAMTLQHKGTLADGAMPVALTGRVYVHVDADAGGSIRPGDLLTTASTPGHAMKVNDFPRAQGAIIGKAMTALDKGKGLVLVLVSLQ